VKLIALFQWAKAGLLSGLAVIAWIRPDEFEALRSSMRLVIYVSARSSPPLFLFPLVAAYLTVVGWGLWSLRKWARNTLMITSGMNVALWARYFPFNLAFQDRILDAQQKQAVYSLMFIDALVFFYLALYDGVPQAFGEKD
jgi:hypothetical protein